MAEEDNEIEQPKVSYVSNEKAQVTTRLIGAIILTVGLGAAYWIYPAGISDVPFAKLTLRMIGDTMLSVVIVFSAFKIALALWD